MNKDYKEEFNISVDEMSFGKISAIKLYNSADIILKNTTDKILSFFEENGFSTEHEITHKFVQDSVFEILKQNIVGNVNEEQC